MKAYGLVRVLVAFLFAFTCAHAGAGTVGYRINGGSIQTITVSDTPPYTDIEIPIGFDASQALDIHIFGAGTAGNETSVGMVTIRGRMDPNSSYLQVRVAVATSGLSGVGDVFVDPMNNNIVHGFRNFGGLRFLPPTAHPTSPSLQDHTAVSVTVRGDITGDITAQQLFRVAALRYVDTTPHYGGTISGTLRSTRSDGQSGALDAEYSRAIRYVRAEWEISGDIIALPELDPNSTPPDQPIFRMTGPLYRQTWSSIERVTLQNATGTAPGITGNILAEWGEISEVWTTGQIGTSASERSTIAAGVRLKRLSTQVEGTINDETVLPLDVFADVECSARGVTAPHTGPGAEYGGSSTAIIECGGDYAGSVSLFDFFGLHAGGSDFQRSSGRRGIFVGGNFTGDIHVTHSFQYGDIVARSFRGGDIIIGQMLKGSIIAVGTGSTTDALDGTINSVTIGYGEDFSGAPRPNNMGGFNSTQNGMSAPPFEGADRERWYTMGANDNNTCDSVIRAEKSIFNIDLKAMGNRLANPSFGGKYARARIESPHISELKIENFDSGSVWSGKLNSTTFNVTNLMADDYAVIDDINIGCMGPKADLWVESVPFINIYGDMFGEIHLPKLEAGHVLRIGGKFGETAQAVSDEALCQAEDGSSMIGYQFANGEDSPRAVWSGVDGSSSTYPFGVPDYGRILVRQTGGLEGQIVFDAANDTQAADATFWSGDVLVGTESGGKVFSTDPAHTQSDRVGPYYTALNADHGDGTMGLVPYNMKGNECEPQDGTVVCELTTRLWPITGGTQERETLVVSHFGKVGDSSPGGDIPYIVWRQSMICAVGNCPPPTLNISADCSVLTGQGVNGREVWICRTPDGSGNPVTFGDLYSYTVEPRGALGVTDLRSMDTFVTPAPSVFSYVYNFWLSSLPCFELYSVGTELPTTDDPEIFYTLDDLNRLLLVDFNRDGYHTEADILELFERVATGE